MKTFRVLSVITACMILSMCTVLTPDQQMKIQGAATGAATAAVGNLLQQEASGKKVDVKQVELSAAQGALQGAATAPAAATTGS